ncbi:aldo-keto reductase family 1 member C3-like isoform X2 [Hyperolius riggenbachi]|uniref:aldo-keto reductase family 1 member C3-like isoform X2 n=1 Tax=Hyperolius riggenbachi TaxID=752182 RepID=UPI0035A306AC
MSVSTQGAKDPKLYKDSCIVLSDGHKMPVIALGTLAPSMLCKDMFTRKAQSDSGEILAQTPSPEHFNTVLDATKYALDIGYRHVDCAFPYRTEGAVGQALLEKILEGTVKRKDFFYTTKLWCTFHRPYLVRPAVENVLASAHLDYIDLLIIHHPVSLKAMEQCKDAGLVKSIGLSNFNRRQLEMILNKPKLKYKPVCNQVECHPYLSQKNLLEFCNANDIVLVGYGLLGSRGAGSLVDENCPAVLDDPVLISLAKKYKKTPAQISIRYTLQQGCAVVVKSFNPDHMMQNLQVFDFNLSAEDMKTIDGLNKNIRYWNCAWWKSHPEYPFENGD